MKYTYQEKTLGTPPYTFIERSDGAVIPLDPANSDYQRYLNREAEQSTPSVIDEA
jgi:hypothetical protein